MVWHHVKKQTKPKLQDPCRYKLVSFGLQFCFFYFFGFLEVFVTFGQKPKKPRENQKNQKKPKKTKLQDPCGTSWWVRVCAILFFFVFFGFLEVFGAFGQTRKKTSRKQKNKLSTAITLNDSIDLFYFMCNCFALIYLIYLMFLLFWIDLIYWIQSFDDMVWIFGRLEHLIYLIYLM